MKLIFLPAVPAVHLLHELLGAFVEKLVGVGVTPSFSSFLLAQPSSLFFLED